MLKRQRIGEYAKVSSENISWMKQPVRAKCKSKKRQKETIHEVFVKMCDAEIEDFWKELFLKCSKGEFPKDFNYKNGEIYHRHKKREAIHSNVEKSKEQVKNFFRSMGNILSPLDIDNKYLIDQKQRIKMESFDVQWKEIRSLNVKEYLILEYSRNICDDFSSQNKTFDNIKNAIVVGMIDNEDIQMRDGRIELIKNLCYDDANDCFQSSKIQNNAKIKIPSDKSEKPSGYLEEWRSYMKKKK